jgi:hypothetical protein
MFGKCRIVPKFIDDPPKSPLKRGTLKLFSPLRRGARGDLDTTWYFTNILSKERESRLK